MGVRYRIVAKFGVSVIVISPIDPRKFFLFIAERRVKTLFLQILRWKQHSVLHHIQRYFVFCHVFIDISS